MDPLKVMQRKYENTFYPIPVLSSGIVAACVCLYVRPSVCVSNMSLSAW